MKRKLKITIKYDHNHYALIEQLNNRENEINRGIFLDKDQYEQLRQHFVRISLPDAKKLAEIIKWYRKQIVNHGLPDRKAYRTFCDQKEIELLGNES
jgi:hypothetical protein